MSFSTLGWNTALVDNPHLTTLKLAGFLSDDVVHGDILDAIMHLVSQEAAQTPTLGSRVRIEDLTLSQILQLPSERWENYSTDKCFRRIRLLGEQLSSGEVNLIVVPFNICQSHWVVFFIDGERKSLLYGDPLGWSPPSTTISHINRWLQHHYPCAFEVGESPVSGRQLDSFSCLVATVNIIRHRLFGDPLFMDKTKSFLRVAEYLRLVKVSQTSVGCLD